MLYFALSLPVTVLIISQKPLSSHFTDCKYNNKQRWRMNCATVKGHLQTRWTDKKKKVKKTEDLGVFGCSVILLYSAFQGFTLSLKKMTKTNWKNSQVLSFEKLLHSKFVRRKLQNFWEWRKDKKCSVSKFFNRNNWESLKTSEKICIKVISGKVVEMCDAKYSWSIIMYFNQNR